MHLQLLQPEPLRESLEKLSTAELRDELKSLLGLTAGNLLRLATVVDVLKNRGEDISAINGRFAQLLGSIAAGTLLPEVVVMFSGNAATLRAVAKLTLIEQQRIVEGKALPPPPRQLPRQKAYIKPRPDTTEDRRKRMSREVDYSELMRMGPKLGTPKDVGAMAADIILQSRDREVSLAEFIRIMEEKGLV